MNAGVFSSKLFRMPKERSKGPMPWDGLEELDRVLARLGRGAAAVRLRLAEAMQALFVANGHRTLGFSSFGAWAVEQIERSGRWADDSRAVARRLAELPALREAVYTGRLSWSAVELLARNAKLADEDELLALGKALTVRQLRAELRRRAEEAARTPDVEDDDEREERCTLVLTVEQSHAWAFETTRRLLDRLDGTKALDAVVEAMLAEGMVALTPWLTDGSVPDDDRGRRMTLARRTRRARWVAESLEAGEIGFEAACLLARVASGDNAEAWVERARRRTIKHLREEVDCVETLARVNGRRGRLDPPDEATLDAWFEAERRIKSGEVFGFDASSAGRDAPRHRSDGPMWKLTDPGPVSGGHDAPSQMSGGHDAPSQMSGGHDAPSQMSGGCPDRSQMSGRPTLEQIVEAIRPDHLLSQTSGGRDDDAEPLGKLLRTGAGKVELRLSLREDLFRWWRALQHVHKRSGQPGPFVAFLVAEMWRVWMGELAPDVKWAHIYRRDRHRCSNPTCNRRDVTLHHLKFRSRGGGDDDANVASLCAECHLFGVHEGRLSVAPPADDMVWRLGRTPILEVRGRERVRLR